MRQQSWLSEFLVLDLREHEPLRYVRDDVTQPLVADLRAQRLLLLHGSDEIVRRDCARSVAREIDPDAWIVEWHGCPGTFDINDLTALTVSADVQDGSVIFIVPDVDDPTIAEWIFPWQQTLHGRDHYLVLTTSLPLETWRLTQKEEESFWRRLPANAYGGDLLQEMVRDGLSLSRTDRAQEEDPADTAAAPFTVRESAAQQVAQAELTPHQVDLFIELTLWAETITRPEQVETLLAQVQNPPTGLARLYHEVFSRQQQWIAVGASLLCGLLDRELFAVMQRVLREAWRELGRTIDLLDYADLAQIAPLVGCVHTSAGEYRLEPRFPQQRLALLHAIRTTQWNHLLAMLPILEAYIDERIAETDQTARSMDPNERRYTLCTLGDVLGDIGMVSPVAVRDLLSRLAGREEESARSVALSAMAKWYTHDESTRRLFYATLEGWWRHHPADQPDAAGSPSARRAVERAVEQAVSHHSRHAPGEPLPAPLQAWWQRIGQPAGTTGAQPTGSSSETWLDRAQDPTRHADLVRLIGATLSAHEIERLLDEWRTRWDDRGHGDTVDWIPVAFAAAHIRHAHATLTDADRAWVAEVLAEASADTHPPIADLLTANPFLFDQVFARYPVRLRDVLLYLAQDSNWWQEVVELFVRIHSDQPNVVDEVMDAWYDCWQQHLLRPNDDSLDWDAVQRTVEEISRRIDRPDMARYWQEQRNQVHQTQSQAGPPSSSAQPRPEQEAKPEVEIPGSELSEASTSVDKPQETNDDSENGKNILSTLTRTMITIALILLLLLLLVAAVIWGVNFYEDTLVVLFRHHSF